MIRLLVVVMSANLALLALLTDLCNQNADLKGLHGGGCWVEVPHNCIIVNGECEVGTYDEDYTCKTKKVQNALDWYTITDATTWGHNVSVSLPPVYCHDTYSCDLTDVGLNQFICNPGLWVSKTDEQDQESVSGHPGDQCQPGA